MNKPIAGPNGAPATKWGKNGDYYLVNMWRYRILYTLEYGETVPNVAQAKYYLLSSKWA